MIFFFFIYLFFFLKDDLIFIYFTIYINIDDRIPSLSLAATPMCRGGRHFFLWIAPLYPWYVPNIGEHFIHLAHCHFIYKISRKYQKIYIEWISFNKLKHSKKI